MMWGGWGIRDEARMETAAKDQCEFLVTGVGMGMGMGVQEAGKW